MAIYYFDVSVISRAQGRSAVASVAYRRAAKLLDEKAHRTWNYENKPGVVHSELSVSHNLLHAIPWVKNLDELQQESRQSGNIASQHLWNLVEQTENRVDAQLAREVKFALPVELTLEQNIVLAREFIHSQFVDRGMIADWSVHLDNPENPHVHVMLSMRELTLTGFGRKVREWNSKALNLEWRQKWSEYANLHLKRHLHNVRIDHRSYKAQGIDLLPSVHLGPAVKEMEKRGIRTSLKKESEAIKAENLKRILENPEILARKIFQSIEHHESVFSEKDLAKGVLLYVKTQEEFDSAMQSLKQSKNLICLGIGEDGRERYTTRRMFDLENNIQKIAEKLQTQRHISISHHKMHKVLERYQTKIGKRLTPEQQMAVEHMLSKNALVCIVGKAGTGKSFALGAANAVWNAKGLNVYGIALSGVAARNLGKASGIQSRTIESFKFCVENKILTLSSRDVIVMDEAGMTDSIAMESVLKSVYKANAKLVLVGDYAQLQPVGPGAAFRALLERLDLKLKEISRVYRQNYEWQRKATVHLSSGDTKEGIDIYYKQGFVSLMSNEQQAMQKLVSDWQRVRKQNELKSDDKSCNQKHYLVLAHRNKDVNALNYLIRQNRITEREINEGYRVYTPRGKLNISQNDRILFLENDRELNIKNGQFAVIKHINFTESGKVRSFAAVTDAEPDKVIIINPQLYNNFTYGYAATIHKSQGATVEHSFVYLGGRWWNRNLTYVALTRHKESCHIYAERGNYKNIEVLKNNLNKKSRKDSVLDYPLAFNDRRGINNEGLLKRLPEIITEKFRQIREKIRSKFAQSDLLTRGVNNNQPENYESLSAILKRYVELEIKQTELVNLSHSTRRGPLEENRRYLALAKANGKEIEEFAKKNIHNPDVQREVAKLDDKKISKIYELGGFKAVQDRLNKNELVQQDVSFLVSQLKSKAFVYNYTAVQKQRLDGGRCQGRSGRRV